MLQEYLRCLLLLLPRNSTHDRRLVSQLNRLLSGLLILHRCLHHNRTWPAGNGDRCGRPQKRAQGGLAQVIPVGEIDEIKVIQIHILYGGGREQVDSWLLLHSCHIVQLSIKEIIGVGSSIRIDILKDI